MIETKICCVKLRRIGDVDGQITEVQYRASVPSVGDIVRVAINGKPVRARVANVAAPDIAGFFNVDADEITRWRRLKNAIRLSFALHPSRMSQRSGQARAPHRKRPPKAAA